MPAYPLPSWLPGARDVGAEVLSGIRAGSEIQNEQNRLAQEANLTSLRLALSQQESMRQNQLDQQKLAQAQAQHQQEMSLRQQELRQQQQLNQIKITDAARTYQAQQQFQKWMELNPDANPAEGILKFFPGTMEPATGFGQLARQVYLDKRKIEPPSVVNFDVQGRPMPYLKIPEAGGGARYQSMREQQDIEGRMLRMDAVREMERRRDKLESSLSADPGAPLLSEDPATLSKEKRVFYDAAKRKQDEINKLDDAILKAHQRAATTEEPSDSQDRTAPPAGAAGAGGIKVLSIRPAGQTYSAAYAAPPIRQDVPIPGAAPVPAPAIPPPGVFGQAQRTDVGVPAPAPAPAAPSAPGAPYLVAPGTREPPPESKLPNKPATEPLYGPGEYKERARNEIRNGLAALDDTDLVRAAQRLGITKASYYAPNKTYYGDGKSFDREEFIDFIATTAFQKNLSPLK